jgi:hypothetical protein
VPGLSLHPLGCATVTGSRHDPCPSNEMGLGLHPPLGLRHEERGGEKRHDNSICPPAPTAERPASKAGGSRFESGGGYWRPGRESGRLGVGCVCGGFSLLVEAVALCCAARQCGPMTGDLARGTSCTPPLSLCRRDPAPHAGGSVCHDAGHPPAGIQSGHRSRRRLALLSCRGGAGRFDAVAGRWGVKRNPPCGTQCAARAVRLPSPPTYLPPDLPPTQ